MNNKFVNLPTKYNNFLNESKKIFNIENLKKLSTKSITFNEINEIHNKINNICISHDCNSYDINKMIHRYGKKNSMIDILKNIANLRNKHIVANAYNSPLWKQNIITLKEHSFKTINKKINKNLIERSFFNLLKKYKYDWDGMWSIIELKKGSIHNISVFDPEDFQEIINDLSK
jgi:hypothetical protein